MTTEKHDPWALLREAKRLIAANRLMLGHYSGVREVGSLEDRIDAALDEPVEEVHAACGRVHRNGAVCILETVQLVRERTAERDEARAEVERLRATLAEHEADEKHRQGYGDRLIALAKAEERKQHFQQGYSDAILDGLKREDALKRADEYAEEKMLGWK